MQNLTSFTQSSAGNITLKSGKSLTLSGVVDLTAATVTGLTLSATVVAPDADDGAALGSTSLKWSDLFLASGGVINFNNGNVTLTHAAGALSCNGALTLNIATASSSTTTGGLIVTGGVGIGGAIYVGDTVNILDDKALTLGTTVATAATKITLEFDSKTGIGLFNMGSTSAPMVLATNPGSGVIAHTVNILHSAGAGDCDDLLGSYTKVAFSGDGDSGCTAVGGAFRAYVGTAVGDATVVKELYGIQPWCSHDGTGAITAMSALSAKCDVNTGAFTASTVNAGHFHIEGAGAVTGQFDGVMIEVYPDVTCLDSMLALVVDSGATVTSGIRVSGAMTNAISIGAAAVTAFNFDTAATDKAIEAITANMTASATSYGIRITVGGSTVGYIPVFDSKTWNAT